MTTVAAIERMRERNAVIRHVKAGLERTTRRDWLTLQAEQWLAAVRKRGRQA